MNKTFHTQCCQELTENENDTINNDDLKVRFCFTLCKAKKRYLWGDLHCTDRGHSGQKHALQELGYGTLHCKGAVHKAFLKVVPDKLPAGNLLVNREASIEQFR